MTTGEFLDKAVVLAWHVDYWDYLGWKDPFGSKRATLRQRRYAKALGMKRIGTPFFYAANRYVRGKELVAAVDKSATEAPPVRIEAQATREQEPGKIGVAAWFTRLERGFAPGKDVVVFPVLVQREAVTKCSAGECKGMTLKEHYAVRDAAPPVPLARVLATGLAHEFENPGVSVATGRLSVALLVEDSVRMRTLACTSLPVTRPDREAAVKDADVAAFLAVRNGFDAFVARAGGNKPSAAYDAELMRLCEERDLDLDSWRRIGARLQRARARNDALWRKWGRKVAR